MLHKYTAVPINFCKHQPYLELPEGLAPLGIMLGFLPETLLCISQHWGSEGLKEGPQLPPRFAERWTGNDRNSSRGNVSCQRCHPRCKNNTHKNLFEIFLNQTEISIYHFPIDLEQQMDAFACCSKSIGKW